jgi:tRNA(Ser,Leu) C12 N-acetylase TAN1
LCHHTFQQTSTVNSYLRCLDVWITLLESSQLSAVALALAERILQKMSFKLNARMLKDLDTESLDENVSLIEYIYMYIIQIYDFNL